MVTATWIALFSDSLTPRARTPASTASSTTTATTTTTIASSSAGGNSGVCQPSDVMRLQLSDVVSLLVELRSTVVTIVFDEQAEPVSCARARARARDIHKLTHSTYDAQLPKRERRFWQRHSGAHRWRLAAASESDRTQLVQVISRLWQAIFKVELAIWNE